MLLKVFLLLLKLPPLQLDLVCVLESLVDHEETVCVGPVLVLFDHCHVLPKGCLCVFELVLESLYLRFVHHFVVWLSELNLSPQELDLVVAVGLDLRDMFVLSLLPDLVNIFQEDVHQGLADLPSAFVSEVVGYLVSFFRQPVLHLLILFETLQLLSLGL